ncbi:LEPR-XLL domain-containing protein [Candidatus Accumulibacter sp. ACC005]|uniref:LEPR-XLL domain-containing protein n=1 Tax=Candidatus Accumulibacter sp. ACC005 TaxID=2823331 RepID=UPI003425FDBD
MSQPQKYVRGRRRISALLFSLLRRVSGWLDSWIKRHRAQWATKREQPTNSSTLHFEALEPRLLLSADLAAGSLAYAAPPRCSPVTTSVPCSRSIARITKHCPTRYASPSTPRPTPTSTPPTPLSARSTWPPTSCHRAAMRSMSPLTWPTLRSRANTA